MKHVAIILDGNRTWAASKGLPKFVGHTEGAKNIKRIIKAAIDEKIAYVTMYALSSENFKNRSEDELNHIFSLIEKLESELDLLFEHNVKLKVIGDRKKLPEKVKSVISDLEDRTKEHKTLTLTLAVNYGGRDELIRAAKKANGDLSEESFEQYLDTAGMPDVDLMIRTGGYQRLSNYLPWQTTYAELYFTPIKWPAFSPEDFKAALDWFKAQKRNKGK